MQTKLTNNPPIVINTLVVLYNSKLSDSESIQSIIAAQINRDFKIILTIWNNGPTLLDEIDVNNFSYICHSKKIEFKIYQDIRNVSLSKIYNSLIKSLDFDFFVTFDQDSIIRDDYFSLIIQNREHDVIFPKIILDKITVQNTTFDSPTFNAAETKAIGSGLCISRHIAEKTISLFGSVFDERFAFYFADFSFFSRIKKIGYVSGKQVGEMHHQISGIAAYTQMSEHTKCEAGYGRVLLRYIEKNKSNPIKNTLYCVKFWIKSQCQLRSFLKIMKCMILKRHPRSMFDVCLKNVLTHETDNHGQSHL
ncbi:glycosyl transferase [Candidatus Symbiopectobacterium sp. NZEC135]|uniref:glycosyl transferase n=1 Tax=Candidatus Symbiopectobacterium sp. NZEC135 TaxID=2820471 RepID=UPI002227D6F0|nr:glycosyl transferase [Candidatus Symbiopectobacterium sp. NZEC135]MCW2481858.1 glycosyl transferase [Candidatus Symbiopectobacterium sp. NZEC135]